MTNDTPIVLTGTSLGPNGDVVLRTAAAVASRLEAALHVVHAFYVSDFVGGTDERSPTGDDAEIDDYGEAPEQEVDRQLERLGLAAAVAARHCEAGPPHRVIARVAERLQPMLIVIGGAEGEAARRRGLGSTAARLLARVPCPVLVVHRQPTLPLERVIAATDLSTLSAEALADGLLLVDRLSDPSTAPRIELLLAIDPRQHRPLGRLTDERAAQIAGEHLERFAADRLPDFAERLERTVVAGDPAVRLLQEITLARPDIVVLGTHGRGGFERFLLGSVAAEITAHAPRAALVVPPAAARDLPGRAPDRR